MKKFFCLILLTLLMLPSASYATRYALIIGIGDYPAESGWSKINGDKDVPVVKKILIENGFVEKNIVELKNDQATSKSISTAFQKLINKVGSNDVVYIHFSGHGQRVTDVNGDEEDGFDEAWIPFDAKFSYAKGKYEGENHIIDDQLNIWLSQLRSKVGEKGKITVVADACHSGGGSRAIEDDVEYVVRGTSDDFIIPGTTKQFSGEVGIIDWIFVSACKSYQSNYEYNGMGSLTYALDLYSKQLSSLSSKELKSKISATFREVLPFTQTPVIEVPLEGNQLNMF